MGEKNYEEEIAILEIPYAGSEDPRVNIGKLAALRGSYYLNDLCKETGLGVFKLRLFEERVILADPVAIKVMYNTELTEKSQDFNLALVNGFNLKGYLPTANVNGMEKAVKKRGMWNILYRAEAKHGNNGLFDILKKHWDSVLPSIKDEKTNVDNLIDVVTVRTLTEFFFDKAFDLDLKVFLMWFYKGMTPKNNPGMAADEETEQLSKQMYDYLDSTPWAKEVLPQLLREDKRSAEVLKGEALFFAFVFSAYGMKSGMSSAVPLFLNLDEEMKTKMIKEVDQFNGKDDEKSIDEKLKAFSAVDRFALEVFRYLPPVTQVHAKASKDFVLDSLQGRYMIKKGTFLTGYTYGAQRDPKTFRCPHEFAMTGDQEHCKRNFFAFGGPFNMEPSNENRKCLGQDISLNMVKMFVTMFAKCKIEPVSSLKFTESNAKRVIASDEPLRVKKFEY